MAMTNAEKQKRWRDKRNALARKASHASNARLDAIIRDHNKRGLGTSLTA
jgi:hypothetical protein